MENTPEKKSLECFSSIKSSSCNHNASYISSSIDSPNTQKSQECGFSCSILANLADENNKPVSKLINITQISPDNNPRKMLLPLFYQESTGIPENSNPRLKRSFSADSISSYSYNKNLPKVDDKKIVTTTTINTQGNVDIIEINPDIFKEKVNYEYEIEVKNSGVNIELPEFTTNPCMLFCNNCKSKKLSIVEVERSREKFFEKIQKMICCCITGINTETQVYIHKCSLCSEILLRMNA